MSGGCRCVSSGSQNDHFSYARQQRDALCRTPDQAVLTVCTGISAAVCGSGHNRRNNADIPPVYALYKPVLCGGFFQLCRFPETVEAYCSHVQTTEQDTESDAVHREGRTVRKSSSGYGERTETAAFISDHIELEKGFRMIPYHCISGESVMKVFRVEKMCVHMEEERWIENPLLGIGEERLSGDEEYEMILNPAVFTG